MTARYSKVSREAEAGVGLRQLLVVGRLLWRSGLYLRVRILRAAQDEGVDLLDLLALEGQDVARANGTLVCFSWSQL